MRTILKRHGPSNGGRALARELGIRMMRLEGSRFRPRPGDRIINWGSSEIDGFDDDVYLNNPNALRRTRNKIDQYQAFEWSGVPTVEWTEDALRAQDWIEQDERVLVRTMLRGSQGRGITAHSAEGTAWTCPWREHEAGTYVKVFGRNPLNVQEFRLHVVNGQVIDRQQKRKRRDDDDELRANPYIRSHANGWVFCREGIECYDELDQAAKDAVEALGLDFGAVDCARCSDGRVCVYEVNTAPGLEGTTLQSYARAFRAVAV